MAHPRIPLLGPIEFISDPEIQLYAAIGVVISLTAGLEITLLDIFSAGLKIDEARAGQILFQAKVGSLQRDMAIAAMNQRVAGTPLESNWDELAKRIISATSQNSSRHLLAHNVVRMTYEGGGFGVGAFGTSVFGEAPRRAFFVEQDQRKVLAGVQKPKKENYKSLLEFSQELIGLLQALDQFLASVAELRP